MRRFLSLFLLLLLFLFPAKALAMGVDEAYAAIPHKRTVFDPIEARMRPEEQDYLTILFPLLEKAVVTRVEATRWIQTAGGEGVPYAEYRARNTALMTELKNLPVPKRLKKVRKVLLKALAEQDMYLRDWGERNAGLEKPIRNINADNPHVITSHRYLLAAYMALSKLYPHEPRHNQQAFFDTLCALDFI